MSTALENTLLWLLAGSRGGKRRADIIIALKKRPMNARQIQKVVGLDYKTVRYHLDLLVENQLLTTIGERYGLLYVISPTLDSKFSLFEEIWGRVKPDNNNNSHLDHVEKDSQEDEL
jgi:DNA-binding transcriptional ArsR family regulator